MSINALNFSQLGDELKRLLPEVTGSREKLNTYAGSLNPEEPAGYRGTVPMGRWSAGFFLWKQPKGMKDVFHMLECRIRFDSVHDMVFPLYSVLHEADKRDLRCCCFSQIATAEELEASLRWLWTILQEHREDFDRIAENPEHLVKRQREEFCDFYQKAFFEVLAEPDLPADMRRVAEKQVKEYLADWYPRYNARFTGKTYRYFLEGNFSAALKAFHRGHALNEAEAALAAYMETHDTLDFEPVPAALQDMMRDHPGELLTASASVQPEKQKNGEAQNDTEEAQVRTFVVPGRRLPPSFTLSNALISGLLQWPLWCLLFGALYALDFYWGAQNMKVVLGYQLSDIVFCGWVVAFSTAFLGIPAVAKYRYRNDPDKEGKLEMASRYGKEQAVHTFHMFRLIAVTACTIYIYIFAISGLAFTDTGFYDRNHGNWTTGVYYSYQKVEKVVHTEGDGTMLSGSDWQIELTDGTTLLVSEDYGITEKQFEEKALPLFEAAGVTVEE